MPVFFNGRLIVSPATVSAVNDAPMFNRNVSVGNVLAIIGKAAGGKPLTALRFGSPSEAYAVLGDCDAAKAIAMAFDPSSEVPGPSTVVFVRVDPALRSSLTLKDATSADVITLTSQNYGKVANQIKVKVEAGSVSGKKLTTQIGNDYYSADNVARNAFSVQYSGAGAAATIMVANAAVTLTVDATPTVLDLNDFPTVGQLVDRINAVAGFAATVLDGNGERATLNGLDSVANAPCKAAAYTVTANLQAIVDWFNSQGEGFVAAARVAGAGAVPANVPFTYLSGGTDGVATNSDWQSAFDVLQAEDVQWVVPLSDSAAIHAMADTHAGYMSNIARMERRVLVGGGTGVTDDDALAAAKALNSDRTSYTHLGVYAYNSAGALTLYPAYFAAVLIAAGFAGSNPGTPMTNKALKVAGVERNLRNPTDTDRLILGGVLCVENTQDGFKVVKSISTWLTNSNYNRVEQSTGAAVDFVSRNVRNAVDALRGRKMTPQLLAEAISRADTALRALAQPEPIGPAVIVGDRINPAYKNIVATIEGDVLKVEFQCSPVIPCNYVTVAIHAVPYSGSATA